MKKVMLLMLLSIALSTLGQDTTTLFFDKNWKKVKSKDDSEYYRKMWKADQTWQVGCKKSGSKLIFSSRHF